MLHDPVFAARAAHAVLVALVDWVSFVEVEWNETAGVIAVAEIGESLRQLRQVDVYACYVLVVDGFRDVIEPLHVDCRILETIAFLCVFATDILSHVRAAFLAPSHRSWICLLNAFAKDGLGDELELQGRRRPIDLVEQCDRRPR